MSTLSAIGLALFAAIALAYAAMLQHTGVNARSTDSHELKLGEMRRVLADRRWLLGLLILIIGNAANVVALNLAPVMVVQPIGAASLITAVILAVTHRGLALNSRVIGAIAVCGAAVAGFVSVAALIGRYEVHFGASAHRVAWIALAVTVIFGLIVLLRSHPPQLLLITASGLLFATVATNVHIVSNQFEAAGLSGVTWFNVATLVLAAALGSWFMQTAYAAGPPEMVIAGLTVIDPIFAVLLGSIVLGEAAGAPVWQIIVMGLTGALACWAVVMLSRYHPDVVAKELQRRSAKYGPQSTAASPDE